MKKLFTIKFFLALAILTFSGCSSDDDGKPQSPPPDIYMAGSLDTGKKSWVAGYWKNGEAVPLSEGVFGSWAVSLAVDGDNVYVTGSESNDFVRQVKLWKNGAATTLTGEENYAWATSIAVSNNNVYIAGYESNTAKYWKNGVATPLSTAQYSRANSIVVSGNNVYVAGNEYGEKTTATYWKNGQTIPLSAADYNTYAHSIAVSGNDVYVAGYEGAQRDIAVYWKNGVRIPLTDGSNHAQANAIIVAGSDIYVAGYTYNGIEYVATYWKNGEAVLLPGYETAISIAVSGADVYVVVSDDVEHDRGSVLKNGTVYFDSEDASINFVYLHQK